MTQKRCDNPKIDFKAIMSEGIRAAIFYSDNGSVTVIDNHGTIIKAQTQKEIFPITSVREITKIQSQSRISILGSDYDLIQVLDEWYKVPKVHP